MKIFYIIFFTVCLVFFGLMYYSVWWFIGALAAVMMFVAYRFYVVHLEAIEARNAALEQEVGQLHTQLDHSIQKETKANHEAKRVKQAKQHLLSVINHEIRTPMNGIMGMGILLADTSLNEEQREYADVIRNSGETLLKTVNDLLVNDLLDFSKLDQQEELGNKNFDLRDCVEEVLEMFSAKAGDRNVDLIYDMGEDVPAQIIGDSKRLQQVLMNLVENAVKFTDRGEILIKINSVIHGANKPELRFEIKDTGIGIAEEQLKQLFKGMPAKEKNWNTAGLGLVICKKLVELMGGRLEVKSQLNLGSSFIFHIPLTPGIELARHDMQKNDIGPLEGKRILIVEDNAIQRNVFMKQMRFWRMPAFFAETGEQALNILSGEKNIELVLIDLSIDDSTGIELAKSIRLSHHKTPIIFMNHGNIKVYQQEPGLFSAVLSKPIRQNLLRDKMLEIFSVEGQGASHEPKKLSEEFSKHYPLHILIAEDNMVNQKLAMKMLNKLGYQPDLAKDGKEVMEMVGQEHYDIILMDVQMPEMDGLEATRMIRTCLDVQPVILAMTANVMLGDRDDCIQAGMDDYISKPIELEELLSQLEKWFHAIENRRKISA